MTSHMKPQEAELEDESCSFVGSKVLQPGSSWSNHHIHLGSMFGSHPSPIGPIAAAGSSREPSCNGWFRQAH